MKYPGRNKNISKIISDHTWNKLARMTYFWESEQFHPISCFVDHVLEPRNLHIP